jgi:XTP/dITP diphosphohydrolase
MESLRNNTIEETFELTDAIAGKDYEGIKQELGDLMLHVVFYSKIGEEEGKFNITDVINFLCDKLVFRHPHVFGDVDADNPEKVKYNWEQLKLKEKKSKRGVLGGVPTSLPAMVKAYRVGEKAASAGFDWEKREDVWDRVKEEIAEVDAEIIADDRKHLEEEFGDVFFAMVNAARLYGVDPEMALEQSNRKFIRRFNYIEARAAENELKLKDIPLSKMEEWWQEAKKLE